MKIAKKQVRIIKKIREASGVWRFISLQRAGYRYVWDDRPGHYFLDSQRHTRVAVHRMPPPTGSPAVASAARLLWRYWGCSPQTALNLRRRV
jgi:hypothetical protein